MKKKVNEMGGNIPCGIFLSENFPGGNFPVRSLMGENFPGGNFPQGNFPRTIMQNFVDREMILTEKQPIGQ